MCQRSSSEKEIKKISRRDVEAAVQTIAAGQILAQNKLNDEDFKIIEEISKRIKIKNMKTETGNKDKTKPIPANVYFTIGRSQFSDLLIFYFKDVFMIKGEQDRESTIGKKDHREIYSCSIYL